MCFLKNKHIADLPINVLIDENNILILYKLAESLVVKLTRGLSREINSIL